MLSIIKSNEHSKLQKSNRVCLCCLLSLKRFSMCTRHGSVHTSVGAAVSKTVLGNDHSRMVTTQLPSGLRSTVSPYADSCSKSSSRHAKSSQYPLTSMPIDMLSIAWRLVNSFWHGNACCSALYTEWYVIPLNSNTNSVSSIHSFNSLSGALKMFSLYSTVISRSTPRIEQLGWPATVHEWSMGPLLNVP